MARTLTTHPAWMALTVVARAEEHARWNVYAGENHHIARTAARRLLRAPRPVVGLRVGRWVRRRYVFADLDTPSRVARAAWTVDLPALLEVNIGIWHGGEYVLTVWVARRDLARAPPSLTWAYGGFRTIFAYRAAS